MKKLTEESSIKDYEEFTKYLEKEQQKFNYPVVTYLQKRKILTDDYSHEQTERILKQVHGFVSEEFETLAYQLLKSFHGKDQRAIVAEIKLLVKDKPKSFEWEIYEILAALYPEIEAIEGYDDFVYFKFEPGTRINWKLNEEEQLDYNKKIAHHIEWMRDYIKDWRKHIKEEAKEKERKSRRLQQNNNQSIADYNAQFNSSSTWSGDLGWMDDD